MEYEVTVYRTMVQKVTIVKDSFGTQRGIYICLDGSDPDIEVKEDDDSYL